MTDCRDVRPCLYRVVEGEASPDEAMRTARHLSDCTGCRILLAREVRLARMLESGLGDQVPVGEDFVRSVMDALPGEPPPQQKPRRSTNLKLASFSALATLLWLGGLERAATGAHLPVPGAPAFDLGSPGHVEGLAGVGRLLAVAANAAWSGLPAVATPDGILRVGLAVGGSAVLAGFAAVALVAVATRTLLRA